MARDQVCGMSVDEKTAKYKTIKANSIYYFCSASCQNEFNKNPDKYSMQSNGDHHASHYGGYCGPSGCGAPARGPAWYFYIGLLFLLLLLLLFFVR